MITNFYSNIITSEDWEDKQLEIILESLKEVYNNNTYYYTKNIQGDIINILDSNLNKIVSYTYDSWGNIISIKDENNQTITDPTHIGLINPFRYRSYYYDQETNLYYLNSRYYSPEFGRFINADGIIGANEDLIGNNLYAYTSNNPVMNIDPNGNFLFSIAALIIGATGVGLIISGVALTAKKNSDAAKAIQQPPVITCINCDGPSMGIKAKTKANLNSSSYKKDNNLYKWGYSGQCTWYAMGRALEVTNGEVQTPASNAVNWYDGTNLPKGKSIKSDSIAVFSGGKYGHVVYVEHWDPETNMVTFSEGNINSTVDGEWYTVPYKEFVKRTNPPLKGYIYVK